VVGWYPLFKTQCSFAEVLLEIWQASCCGDVLRHSRRESRTSRSASTWSVWYVMNWSAGTRNPVLAAAMIHHHRPVPAVVLLLRQHPIRHRLIAVWLYTDQVYRGSHFVIFQHFRHRRCCNFLACLMQNWHILDPWCLICYIAVSLGNESVPKVT